jgi:hypothetical protein
LAFASLLALAPAAFRAGPARADAAAKFPDLAGCYQRYGQLEETNENGKKVTVYKDQAVVAAACNKTVIARAAKAPDAATRRSLAELIGTQSNWASAVPVYTLMAKADKTNATCADKDVLYALDASLSHPSDDLLAKDGVTLMNACWPKNKAALAGMLTPNANSYVKDALCTFLKGKKALPADKVSTCAS